MGLGSHSRYEKQRKLGEGTFGVVYLAQDRQSGRYVAIKKLRTGNSREGVSVPAIREIKLLQELHHPNIIGMLDVFAIGSSINLVFEYAVTDLEHVIADRTLLLRPVHVKTMMHMMLKGLAKMHDAWTLHRDLKPGNILVGADGELKLGDFGLAKLFGTPSLPKERQERLTSNVITLWYRPPELLFGSTQYVSSVDIWSMGCIFAELVLRAPYMPGELNSDIDQLRKICAARGTPNEENWEGCTHLPGFVQFSSEHSPPKDEVTFVALGTHGVDLISKMLILDPRKRISARAALSHPYFTSSQPEICSRAELLNALRAGRCISKDVPDSVWPALNGLEDENTTGDNNNNQRATAHPVRPTPADRGARLRELNGGLNERGEMSSLRKRKLEFT